VEKVNLHDKLASFQETWVPKVVGQLNGQYVKVVKVQDDYVWHHHDNEDELFFVVSGELTIHFRDGDAGGDRSVSLREGEFVVVPRGVTHKPSAPKGAEVMLFEPATTRNTGNVDHDYTIEADDLEKI
jgi:mannose-6-phosphate isomerase-like protein (cupin superfamily)